MIQGQPYWDPIESLRQTKVEEMNWGSLFALALQVKARIYKGLVLDKVPALSVQNVTQESHIVEVASVNLGFHYGDAISEPTGLIINFHTTGLIRNQVNGIIRVFKVLRILIDGGAVVNLIPESIAQRLGLLCEANDDILIRTATNEIRQIH